MNIRLNLPLSYIFPESPCKGVFFVASCFPAYDLAVFLVCMSVADKQENFLLVHSSWVVIQVENIGDVPGRPQRTRPNGMRPDELVVHLHIYAFSLFYIDWCLGDACSVHALAERMRMPRCILERLCTSFRPLKAVRSSVVGRTASNNPVNVHMQAQDDPQG
jgi:hypothetical protein